MPFSDPLQRFGDIIENIDRIERFTAGMELQDFTENEQVILAVRYALLIVSGAAVKLSDLATALCPDIPWREIRGLGNRLRHDYLGIDDVRLWLLVKRDLPPLKIACRAALAALQQEDPE
ncbi:MAG TPA: HepT-like ribonuclease domain-containing protein [Stellaceae bacterium]|nr:HepT-like ribonuclease domain-containing protein [Stellaceae bacterium]